MAAGYSPIGIFDSGIGGLTVASAIKQHLPNQTILYFGDTVHLPYGDKSASSIKGYIRNITRFLADEQCAHLVVACNSASSVLTRDLVAPGFKSVLNVIDPVVEHVCGLDFQRIGVIGTKRTINSHIYRKRIHALRPDMEVVELATPLLAPMIEEGFIRNSIATAVIHEYLEQLTNVQALILGCTHYPLIRPQIAQFYGSDVALFDAPELIAQQLRSIIPTTEPRERNDHFYVSDFTASFEETARMFFGQAIRLEEKRLED